MEMRSKRLRRLESTAARPKVLFHADLKLGLRDFRWVNDHLRSLLNLENRWFQGDDLAGRAKFHIPPERSYIKFRQRISNLLAIQRTGLFDGDLQYRACGTGRSLGIVGNK